MVMVPLRCKFDHLLQNSCQNKEADGTIISSRKNLQEELVSGNTLNRHNKK